MRPLGVRRVPLLDHEIAPGTGDRRDEVDIATTLVPSGNDHIFGQDTEQFRRRRLVGGVQPERHHGQFDIVRHDRQRYAAAQVGSGPKNGE